VPKKIILLAQILLLAALVRALAPMTQCFSTYYPSPVTPAGTWALPPSAGPMPASAESPMAPKLTYVAATGSR
jgi:hypothetical protein